ncbi:MAG TPA: glutamate--tRNA ligase [Deltaproteobacteria bacterium]|nr:glutamate--tRNA ligase [Deltaproteobacteria bacterium]
MIRVRFAPSPTGLLHQGNVRTALFNFLYARHHGGKLILRIEDTDQERSQENYEAAILQDLKWLGLEYDEGPDRGGELGPYRQSERGRLYQQAMEKLRELALIYPCFCTPEELEAERRKAMATGKPIRYSGKCRELPEAERQAKMEAGLKPALRFKVEREIVKFNDLVYGEKIFDTLSIGDFVIARSNELPLYLFACAVDDCLMQISHVIRGEDGMSNTPRQILIQKALGYEPPSFAHLPLILGPDHALLSKRNGSMSVGELQAKGYLPAAILNYLSLLGWSPPEGKDFLGLPQLIEAFDLSRVARSSAIFDWAKLDHLNHVYLMKLSETEYLSRAQAALAGSPADSGGLSGETLEKVLLAVRPNLRAFSELPGWVALLGGKPQLDSAEAREVLQAPESRKVLETLAALVQNSESEMNPASYENLLEELKKKTKVKGKKLFMPVRVALTGGVEGPELAALVTALGKTQVLERVRSAFENLQHEKPH